MSKKRKDEELVVSFADAESTNNVTGSCVQVGSNILLDCGLQQGKGIMNSYAINNANYKFKAKDIEYVFISHPHIDHSGLVSKLIKRGGNPIIITPTNSIPIINKLLLNCAFILESEAKYIAKKSKNSKECLPIYEECDVVKTVSKMKEYEVGAMHQLDDKTRFKFIYSGHITHACSILLEIKVGNIWKSVFYTGDLGNSLHKQYYTENMETISHADVVISESTYSTKRQSNERTDERDRDMQRIESAIEQSHTVLFPAFSFGRAQTLVTMLYEMYKDKDLEHDIYMDSVLMNEINNIIRSQYPEFERVLGWDKVHCISRTDREALFNSKSKKIVIASSGMLQGNSASVSWLSHIIEKEYNTIVFSGYLSENSIGRKIKDVKQKTLTISGYVRKNKANVVTLKSMSGHIQHSQLVDYLTSINCEKIVLHHGNSEGKVSLKKDLQDELSKRCKSTKVVIANKKTKIRL